MKLPHNVQSTINSKLYHFAMKRREKVAYSTCVFLSYVLCPDFGEPAMCDPIRKYVALARAITFQPKLSEVYDQMFF